VLAIFRSDIAASSDSQRDRQWQSKN